MFRKLRGVLVMTLKDDTTTIPRCQARHPEEGQCELREGHYDALKGKHLAGTAIWGEELPAATPQAQVEKGGDDAP